MSRYRIDPDSELPLRKLLNAHRASLADVARRCGYTNVAKGIRRLEELADGNLRNFASMRIGLAPALGVGLDHLDAVAEDTRYLLWARDDRRYRAEFRPHVVWATTKSVPSPITIAAMINAHRQLFWYPSPGNPSQISGEAVLAAPRGVPCYGFVVGFHVNYTPDNAVSFDLDGTPVAVLDTAVRPGRARASIGGRLFAFAVDSVFVSGQCV